MPLTFIGRATIDPFRVSLLLIALSGGVAPGYYLAPFQGNTDGDVFPPPV